MLPVLILALVAVIFVAVIVAILTSRYMLGQDLEKVKRELEDSIPLGFWENHPDAEREKELMSSIDCSIEELKRSSFPRKMAIIRVFNRQIPRLMRLSSEVPELLSKVYEKLGQIDDSLDSLVLLHDDDTPTKGRKKRAIKVKHDARRFLRQQVPCYSEWGHVPSEEERIMKEETSDTNCSSCFEGGCPFNINPSINKKRQPE